MYQYHFKYNTFNGEEWSRMTVRDHELDDEEIQKELTGIFNDHENVKSAILENVVKVQ